MIRRLELPVAWTLCAVIRAYQLAVSPFLPRACRFYPSCSQYALDVLHSKRLFPALWFIVRRVARCQPLHPGGYDPAP